jgi:two-component system OmpR family sensor kinase
MIATAQANATLRGFGRRVPEPHPGSHDELATLARTFNEMLDALQGAYVAQQRFIADAAHELRAPLTAIRGNVELLERVKDMPAPDREEALADLQRESLRLLGLVEQLLQLARSDAGLRVEFRPVEFDAVLLQAIADMRSLPGASRLELNALVPVTVMGDADRLRQLATILLDNAQKYTPLDGRIHVWLFLEGADVILRVEDTGVGIAPEDLAHVFERFYRADPARTRDPGGSGLGLAIAQSIAEQHRGAIQIESRPGVGTTVSVRLPVAGAGAGASAAATRADADDGEAAVEPGATPVAPGAAAAPPEPRP